MGLSLSRAGYLVPGLLWVVGGRYRAAIPLQGATVTAKPRTLDALLDTAGVMFELNIKRTAAEALMRELPKVIIPGYRKAFVKRSDVQAYIDDNTRAA